MLRFYYKSYHLYGINLVSYRLFISLSSLVKSLKHYSESHNDLEDNNPAL